MPVGPGVAASGAKMLARNLPLVLLLGLIALLFWPSANAGETANAGQDEAATDDSDCRPPASNGVDRHAA